MKSFFTLVLFLGSFFNLVGQASSTFWQEAQAPYGSSALGLHYCADQTLYANNSRGTFRSVDFGLNWQPVNNPVFGSGTAVDNRLWIGRTGKLYKWQRTADFPLPTKYKVYVSTNGGDTWALHSSNVPGGTGFMELGSGVLLAAGQLQDPVFSTYPAIFRSDDAGATWTLALELPNWNLIMKFYWLSDGSVALQSPYDTYMRSADEGLTWAPMYGHLPNTSDPIFIAPATGTFFSWGSYSSGLFSRSTDQSVTWQPILLDSALILPGEYIQSLQAASDSQLLASSQFRLWTSFDDGLSWSPVTGTHGIRFHYEIPALPDGTLFGNGASELFRSDDQGMNWTFSAHGIRNARVISLDFITDSVFFAGTAAGLWYTENAGADWTLRLPNHFGTGQYARPGRMNADTLFVLADSTVFRSTDGGQTFAPLPAFGNLVLRMVFASNVHKLLLATVNGGLLRASCDGQNWQFQPGLERLNVLAEHPSGRLYGIFNPVSYGNGRLKLSDDGGQNWVLAAGFPDSAMSTIQVTPGGRIYAVGFENGQQKLYKSADNGQHWTIKILPFQGVEQFESMSVDDQGVIIIQTYLNIYRSYDDGSSWELLPTTNFNSYGGEVEGIFVSPGHSIYVAKNYALLVNSDAWTTPAMITGTVFRDADDDCSTPDNQPENFSAWVIKADGTQDVFTVPGGDGAFSLSVAPGIYSMTANPPVGLWWTMCDSTQSAVVDSAGLTASVTFRALANGNCPFMTTQIQIPFLRRCFDNTIYVSYCNEGTETAVNAYIDLFLEPKLTLVASTLAFLDLGNNSFRFDVGSVTPSQCGYFTATVYAGCDSTVIGQTACITAHAFPDTLCMAAPGWSGASLQGSASCQDSVVMLRLQNTGSAPSQMLDYVIIEDDVVLFQGSRNYLPGESLSMVQPANGHTWRIESTQEPGHPFSRLALAFLEGCGGFESLGYINDFPINDVRPSWHRSCRELNGSYDPNDKQGFPLGYGADHNIRPGQPLDYLVRFQNTGTDTAFTVVIRDTLSAWLDPASVRPGPSSHPYTWTLEGNGVLVFTFNNIQLPDSNVNEPLSHGFVTFVIDQQPNLDVGSVIFNQAAIYFDFNEPVLTNQTWHTLWLDYLNAPLTVSTKTPEKPGSILIHPNPVAAFAVVQPRTGVFAGERLTLVNAFGQVAHTALLRGSEYRLDCRDQAPGAYFYRVTRPDGTMADSGMLVVQ